MLSLEPKLSNHLIHISTVSDYLTYSLYNPLKAANLNLSDELTYSLYNPHKSLKSFNFQII